MYSQSLARLSDHLLLHDGTKIHESNAVPAVLSWLRKSHDMEYNEAVDWLKKLESECQRFCGNCSKEAEAGEKYKQCSKCRAQWYCSKECQVEAWRAGHKKDCKRASILKFEDYINAE